jgi:hypothetical protein
MLGLRTDRILRISLEIDLAHASMSNIPPCARVDVRLLNSCASYAHIVLPSVESWLGQTHSLSCPD